MPLPHHELDPVIRDQFDRYILMSNKEEDNLRRGALVAPYTKSCGERLRLAPGATLPYPDNLIIGDDVYVGLWTYIGGGHITLEDLVMIGPHCTVTGGDHRFNPELDDFSGTHKRGGIVVGHGSWLAAGVVVTAGVRVGRANLIAAGAVVTADTPDYAVMAGVPAKQIGNARDF